MNSFIFVSVALVFATVIAFGSCQRENADIDTLLADKNFVRKQINCVLGKSRCDKFGVNLKASIPKVINQNCESCTPEESENAKKIISFVQKNYPDVWKTVNQRYSG